FSRMLSTRRGADSQQRLDTLDTEGQIGCGVDEMIDSSKKRPRVRRLCARLDASDDKERDDGRKHTNVHLTRPAADSSMATPAEAGHYQRRRSSGSILAPRRRRSLCGG